MDNCPVSGKPCLKYKAFHVTEKMGVKTNSYVVCEDCLYNNPSSKLSIAQEDVSCACGTKLSDIMKGSKMGCANCYDSFEDMKYIISAVQNIKDPNHTGKAPYLWKMKQAEDTTCAQFTTSIKQKIKSAVEVEDYKKAIWLKKQIEIFYEIEKKYLKANEEQTPSFLKELVEFIYNFREQESELF